MTTQETLNVLKKNPEKWFTPKELAKLTKVNAGNVTTHLNRLFKEGDVSKKIEKIQCWYITFWRYKD